jgi:hypothetical protein
MTNSESVIDIKDLINDYKKDFEQASLCHNQTGKWLYTQSTWFQYATGIAALFILGRDTIEWTNIEEKTGGEKALLIISTVLGIMIEVIAIINRIKEPAKNSELHFQKSDKLVKMKKTINYKRIKCHTYDDYNKLYLEIEEQSSKLPIIRIPDWAINKVNNQLKDGPSSIQDMREERRNASLKRSGVKLNKNDKELYKNLDKASIDVLRDIAASSTVKRLDTQTVNPQVRLMNHDDILDYLKCKLGVRANNLTEKHRNDILNHVNKKIIQQHFVAEMSRVHGRNVYESRQRRLSEQQMDLNKLYVQQFSRSQVVSEVLSDDDNFRLDNIRIDPLSEPGDGIEGLVKAVCESTDIWEDPPPYFSKAIALSDQIIDVVSIKK